MNDEIRKLLEQIEEEYLSTRNSEERGELEVALREAEEEARDFVWLG